MGGMFEQLLSGHDLAIWERDPESGEENAPVEDLCADRDIVLFALPAHPHRELAERLAERLDERCVCLSIAKGLDADGWPPSRMFEDVFGDRLAWGMICGPMIADDLSAGRSGFALLASPSERGREAAGLFDRTPLFLDVDDDVHGAGWAVILKNVFVPLIGAADALELGDNLRGFLVAEATSELSRIVAIMGGRRETAFGPAGLGDLVTTATSARSHHREIGADLASGRTDRVSADDAFIRSEGVHTVERVREFELFPPGDFPLFELAADFLSGAPHFEPALHHYLLRRFRREA
jgi:glycerol-3-phosphate dehydrogenase (NAD(P)+)